MTSDCFRVVAETISARDAAVYYGVYVNNRGFARCPWHEDKTPSLHFHGNQFHCFSCNAGGDSISFVSRLFNLSAFDALKLINEDFRLGLDLNSSMHPTEIEAAKEFRREKQKFEAWRNSNLRDLCSAYRYGHLALNAGRELTDDEAIIVKYMAVLEFAIETLETDNALAIYQKRNEVKPFWQRILATIPDHVFSGDQSSFTTNSAIC